MGAVREEWVSEKKNDRTKAFQKGAVGELWNASNQMGISKPSNQKSAPVKASSLEL